MSARPWMPFYVGDYLGDTAHLSTLQHGAYLLLMLHYWRHEGLPDDDEQLARIAGMTANEWRKNRAILRALFKGEGWRHHRIDREIYEAIERYERRAKAGRKGGKSKPGASNAQAMLKQSQSQPHSCRGQGAQTLEGVAQGPRLAVVNGGRTEPAIGFDDDGRLIGFDTAEVPF